MHEYGLAEDLLEHAREAMRAEGLTAVRGIRVELGNLSNLSREALETAFRAVARGTEFADTALDIEEAAGHLECDACGAEGSPEDLGSEEASPPPPWICPDCGYLMRATKGQGVRFAGLLPPIHEGLDVEVNPRKRAV